MKAYAKRCRAKFARLDTLNSMVKAGGGEAVGARKVKKELADTWDRRKPSPGKYWVAKTARAVSRGLV